MTSEHGALIIGATPQGMQAALTLARCGRSVTVIERCPQIDRLPGRWNQEARRWYHSLTLEVSYHHLISLLTETEVTEIRENKHGIQVELVQRPQWVLSEFCVDCKKCLPACPVDLPKGKKPLYELRVQHAVAIDKREKAPCGSACPLGMNPQGYIALIAQGRFDEAQDLILGTNPLPGICGRVCHHPCETACRRREIDAPVAICALKRFASDEARKKGNAPRRKAVPQSNGHRVAIIGSGPAGLTAAYDLALAGIRPTLIEAEDRPGGLLLHGIAPYRLPREIIEEEIKAILSLGVDMRLNTLLKSWDDIQMLRSEGFDAVLLSTGASKDLKMNIQGEDLKGVMGCVSFLKGLWKGLAPGTMGRVAVVGGGNAAVEAARACVRAGAESVILIYRRTRDEMPADSHEVEQALEEGVNHIYLTAPLAFVGRKDRLEEIRCIRMKLGRPDASGRPKPVPVKGSEFSIKADRAIISIGQEVDSSFRDGNGLGFTRWGTIETGETGETNIPWIYAAGDVVSGPSMVIDAMASGRRAAVAIIHDLLYPQTPDREDISGFPRKPYEPVDSGIPKKDRTPLPHRKISERMKDHDEVIGPYSGSEAIEEASRCLQCGICSECLRCEDACDLDAIRHDRVSMKRTLHFEQIIVADNSQILPEFDSKKITPIKGFGKSVSWSKAVISGRAVAVDLLPGTSPSIAGSLRQKILNNVPLRTGIFICSCNETLNGKGQLTGMIPLLEGTEGVAHVEVLTSACHPEKGLRIEEVIREKELNNTLIASCTCCHLDFVCESCNEQRIRLKKRLFRDGGFLPGDITLVNIKETCLLPFEEDLETGILLAARAIKSGLIQLREAGEWPLKDRDLIPKALILGATEAGISAAKGLLSQFPSVVLIEEQRIEKRLEKELKGFGIEIIHPIKPIRIEGQRGEFTLISERLPESPDREIPENNELYHRIKAGIIILGSNEYRNISYRRDPFVKDYSRPIRKAFGNLETGIPGVYVASWAQARKVPDEEIGKAVAGKALEEVSNRDRYFQYLVAKIDPELCRGCSRCADICPEGAAHLHEISRGVASSMINPDLCTGCGNCIAECPTGAIRMPEFEQEYFERVMDVIL